MKQLLTITALLFSLNGFGQSSNNIVKWQLVEAVPTACPDASTADKFGRISGSYYSCAVFHCELKRKSLSKSFYSLNSAIAFYNELMVEANKSKYLISGGIDSIILIVGDKYKLSAEKQPKKN